MLLSNNGFSSKPKPDDSLDAIESNIDKVYWRKIVAILIKFVSFLDIYIYMESFNSSI